MAKAIIDYTGNNTIGKMLSFPHASPFYHKGRMFISTAGFCIGICFPPGDPLRDKAFGASGKHVFSLIGKMSKKTVWWNDTQVPYGSPEHIEFLKQALVVKYGANPDARRIMEMSRGFELELPPQAIESQYANLGAKGYLDLLARVWETIVNPPPQPATTTA